MNYICLFASGIIGSLDTTHMTWLEENFLILLSQASTNSHLSTMATFLADSPYIVHWLLFKSFSTMATFFCPRGGHCGGSIVYLTELPSWELPDRFASVFK